MEMTLYAVSSQYRALADRLADMDLDATTVADTIESSGLQDALQDKAQGVECVARAVEMHLPAIDGEIARLQALKARRVKIAQGLRDYLRHNMEQAGVQRIDCPLFSLSLRKNPPSVDVFDEAQIPPQYWTAPKAPDPKPNKSVIASLLKAGADVPGARLTQGTRLDVA